MYNKDDVIYILENNTTIRKGKIARKQGDNYIIQLIGSCGALTMPEDQLFESEEAAEKSRQQDTNKMTDRFFLPAIFYL